MSSAFEKRCFLCGSKYESTSNNAKYCPECRKQREREYWRQKSESFKKPSKIKRKSIPLGRVVRMLDKYNKVHNTRYSYGYFVYLLESGKIETKPERSKKK